MLLLFWASWPSLVVACRRRGAVSACGDCRDGSRSTDGRHSHVLHMRPRCRTTAVGLTQPGLRRSPWCYRGGVLSALRFPVWSEIRSTALRRALTGISSGTRPSASAGTCKCQVPALAHLEDAWSVFRQPSGPTATSVPYLINGPAKDVQHGLGHTNHGHSSQLSSALCQFRTRDLGLSVSWMSAHSNHPAGQLSRSAFQVSGV